MKELDIVYIIQTFKAFSRRYWRDVVYCNDFQETSRSGLWWNAKRGFVFADMLNAIWYLISDFGFGIYSTMSQIEEKSEDTVYVIEINWNNDIFVCNNIRFQ